MILGLVQCNPTVGDVDGNTALIKRLQTAHLEADLLIFPELVLSGYPPEDLVLQPVFMEKIDAAIADLARATKAAPALLIGAPWLENGNVYNAAILLQDGHISGVTAKYHLPNYGVFDEKRVFTAGTLPNPLIFQGLKLGVMICEDMWHADVAKALNQRGSDLFCVLNASPFETGKPAKRLDIAASRVRENKTPLVYVNIIGGQDELVFDGRSFCLSPTGQPVLQMPPWEEKITLISAEILGVRVLV
jgi:NAD+ synthase